MYICTTTQSRNSNITCMRTEFAWQIDIFQEKLSCSHPLGDSVAGMVMFYVTWLCSTQKQDPALCTWSYSNQFRGWPVACELAQGNKLCTNQDDDKRMSLSTRSSLTCSLSGIRTRQYRRRELVAGEKARKQRDHARQSHSNAEYWREDAPSLSAGEGSRSQQLSARNTTPPLSPPDFQRLWLTPAASVCISESKGIISKTYSR